MEFDEYLRRQQVINIQMLRDIGPITEFFRGVDMTEQEWRGYLSITFPYVEEYRYQAAELGRTYFDEERAKHVPRKVIAETDYDTDYYRRALEDPEPDRHPVYLAHYELDWYREAMNPVKNTMRQPGFNDNQMAEVLSIPLKEVENGGRRTIIRAVESDPKSFGWARVQGGEDSCAFCTMLISRGPVYASAQDAGLNADETSAVEIFRQAEESGDDSALMGLMTRWHPRCDCKVVPVFNKSSWPGRDEYYAAERLWKRVTKGYSGLDALNALRRYLEGQVYIPPLAIAA